MYFVADNGGADALCPTQESKLAVLWTVGIFALNFGPVFVGPVLDYFGPKLTSILGEGMACCVRLSEQVLVGCTCTNGITRPRKLPASQHAGVQVLPNACASEAHL